VPLGFYRRISSEGTLLSFKARNFFRIEMKFNISKESFFPRPKTESVLIVVKPLSENDYKRNPERYVLREMFLQKRKKMKNALMEGVINLNKRIMRHPFTKRMSKEIIRKMSLEKDMLEKDVKDLSIANLIFLEKRLSVLRRKPLRRAG
jgi:16S rRNA A1518/A1519 N6-dimethyltransferase RsmA/KsgA/DIM1 with predicted DNA glycosylase/AP lyase activity